MPHDGIDTVSAAREAQFPCFGPTQPSMKRLDPSGVRMTPDRAQVRRHPPAGLPAGVGTLGSLVDSG